jgi:hypothetical protein
MIQNRHRRAWLLVAAITIAVALVLMLVPHGHAGSGAAWLAVLPVLFVGMIAPLRVSPVPECFDLGRTSDAPSLQPSFQRPPPFRRA